MSANNQQPCCSKQLARRKPELSEEEVDQLLLSDSEDEDETSASDVDIDDDYVQESTEEETDEEGDKNNWVRYVDGNLQHFRFTVQNSGIQIPMLNRPNDEMGYFQLFFTDELLHEIVNTTNNYAEQKLAKLNPLPKYSVFRKWKETNLKELKALLGVLINMALNPKSELYEYFHKNG